MISGFEIVPVKDGFTERIEVGALGLVGAPPQTQADRHSATQDPEIAPVS